MSDPTTDPKLRSFVPVDPESPFPIQNLPFGIFRPRPEERPRVGVAIGEMVLDLSVLESRKLFGGSWTQNGPLFDQPALNRFMEMGRTAWKGARETISGLLHEDNPKLRDDVRLRAEALLPIEQVKMELPAAVGDYTDFYSSREHATNVGMMFRGKENALMPNWLYLPVAYHGRASSLVGSGAEIRRPKGQTKKDDEAGPSFGPSRLLDIELEMGFFVGPGNELGSPIPIERAADHIFGMVIVNDWSARDIQKWEYQPLGPFLAKNFATSISPWVVTLEALEPFRCASPVQDPTPLPYLQSREDRAYDIQLEVLLNIPGMESPYRLALSNFRYLYWNICQQLAHHSVTGCNMRPGDLLASGTISGPDKESRGSLLEITWAGKEPIALPNGEERRFLQDGDGVTIRGWCQGEGYRVGFGDLSNRIAPANE